MRQAMATPACMHAGALTRFRCTDAIAAAACAACCARINSHHARQARRRSSTLWVIAPRRAAARSAFSKAAPACHRCTNFHSRCCAATSCVSGRQGRIPFQWQTQARPGKQGLFQTRQHSPAAHPCPHLEHGAVATVRHIVPPRQPRPPLRPHHGGEAGCCSLGQLGLHVVCEPAVPCLRQHTTKGAVLYARRCA